MMKSDTQVLPHELAGHGPSTARMPSTVVSAEILGLTIWVLILSLHFLAV